MAQPRALPNGPCPRLMQDKHQLESRMREGWRNPMRCPYPYKMAIRPLFVSASNPVRRDRKPVAPWELYAPFKPLPVMAAAMPTTMPTVAAPRMAAEPEAPTVARAVVGSIIRRVAVIVRVAVVNGRPTVVVAAIVPATIVAVVVTRMNDATRVTREMAIPRLRRGRQSERGQSGHPKSKFTEEFHS